MFAAGASKNAEGLFQDVLGRKDDADRTRNALNVLQRFRFLFSLPQCIERNIQLVNITNYYYTKKTAHLCNNILVLGSDCIDWCGAILSMQ